MVPCIWWPQIVFLFFDGQHHQSEEAHQTICSHTSSTRKILKGGIAGSNQQERATRKPAREDRKFSRHQEGGDGARTFEHWVVVHDDGNHADIRQVASRPTDHVLLVEPLLSCVIQATVVNLVVVSLRQQVNVAIVLLVYFQHAVNDGYVASSQFEDDNVPNPVRMLRRDLQEGKHGQRPTRMSARSDGTHAHRRSKMKGVCMQKRERTQLLRNSMSPRWNAGSILPLRTRSEFSARCQGGERAATLPCAKHATQRRPGGTHLRTTTTGLSLAVNKIRDFQMISAEARIMPRLTIC
jgi:hypothetical protein